MAAVRTVRVRLGDAECEALDALCARWACAPSEAIRRALRGGARIRSDAPPDVRAWFEDVLGASVPKGETT